VWITILGEIWKHQNMFVFKNERVNHLEVFAVAQRKVWAWITSKEKDEEFTYFGWCLEPMVCMNSKQFYLLYFVMYC